MGDDLDTDWGFDDTQVPPSSSRATPRIRAGFEAAHPGGSRRRRAGRGRIWTAMNSIDLGPGPYATRPRIRTHLDLRFPHALQALVRPPTLSRDGHRHVRRKTDPEFDQGGGWRTRTCAHGAMSRRARRVRVRSVGPCSPRRVPTSITCQGPLPGRDEVAPLDGSSNGGRSAQIYASLDSYRVDEEHDDLPLPGTTRTIPTPTQAPRYFDFPTLSMSSWYTGDGVLARGGGLLGPRRHTTRRASSTPKRAGAGADDPKSRMTAPPLARGTSVGTRCRAPHPVVARA